MSFTLSVEQREKDGWEGRKKIVPSPDSFEAYIEHNKFPQLFLWIWMLLAKNIYMKSIRTVGQIIS
jgi:hypothetical protein